MELLCPPKGVANHGLGKLQSGARSCDMEILPHHDGSLPGAPDGRRAGGAALLCLLVLAFISLVGCCDSASVWDGWFSGD